MPVTEDEQPDDVNLGSSTSYKQKYSSMKAKLKAILYENELLQDDLNKIQKELLDIYRDKETLLERIYQIEDLSSSGSESESPTSHPVNSINLDHNKHPIDNQSTTFATKNNHVLNSLIPPSSTPSTSTSPFPTTSNLTLPAALVTPATSKNNATTSSIKGVSNFTTTKTTTTTASSPATTAPKKRVTKPKVSKPRTTKQTPAASTQPPKQTTPQPPKQPTPQPVPQSTPQPSKQPTPQPSKQLTQQPPKQTQPIVNTNDNKAPQATKKKTDSKPKTPRVRNKPKPKQTQLQQQTTEQLQQQQLDLLFQNQQQPQQQQQQLINQTQPQIQQTSILHNQTLYGTTINVRMDKFEGETDLDGSNSKLPGMENFNGNGFVGGQTVNITESIMNTSLVAPQHLTSTGQPITQMHQAIHQPVAMQQGVITTQMHHFQHPAVSQAMQQPIQQTMQHHLQQPVQQQQPQQQQQQQPMQQQQQFQIHHLSQQTSQVLQPGQQPVISSVHQSYEMQQLQVSDPVVSVYQQQPQQQQHLHQHQQQIHQHQPPQQQQQLQIQQQQQMQQEEQHQHHDQHEQQHEQQHQQVNQQQHQSMQQHHHFVSSDNSGVYNNINGTNTIDTTNGICNTNNNSHQQQNNIITNGDLINTTQPLSAEELEQHLEIRRLEQAALLLPDWESTVPSEIFSTDSGIKFMAED